MSRCIELRRARPLLGTFVEIKVRGADEITLPRAIDRAFAAVAKVHRLMSFHDQQSEVARLNREAATTPVRVSRETWRVLQAAQHFAKESDGAFDITVAPLLVRWQYLPRARSRPHSRGTWRDIIFEKNRTIRFRRPLLIDLGGIAKGFAVDRAIAALQRAGVGRATVNAGGDLRVIGDREEAIYLRDARDPRTANGFVRLRQRSLATSGTYFSRRRHHGLVVSPLVDGRSLRPFSRCTSVTVAAPECITADALTKIVLALGDQAAPILSRHQADGLIAEGGRSPQLIVQTNAPRCD